MIINDHQIASDLRIVVSRLIRKLRSKSSVSKQLSLTERSVLRLLDEQEFLLPSELAVKEKVTTQSMSQIINHLLGLGYITRTPSETDGRKVLIALSPTGKELLAETRHERDEWLQNAINKTMTTREQQLLMTLLPSLYQLAEVD